MSVAARRWKRFVWQGAVLAVVGLITIGVSDDRFGVAILVVGGLLLFAGLVGGAVQGDEPVGPSA